MKRINLECLPDERLVKKLGYTRKEIRHHNDKGRVCKSLQSEKGLVGMIDEDPGSAQPSSIKPFKHISHEHHVKLLKNERTGNSLVVLCPRLEEWLIQVCKSNGIDINKDFGLGDSGNVLHREINNKLDSLDKLLSHLIEDKKAPQLVYLKMLLKGK